VPRNRDELTSGASGREALATYRDEDYEDFVAAVRYLPTLAARRGMDYAIAFVQNELRSLVDLMAVAKLTDDESKKVREDLGLFWQTGSARFLCEGGSPCYHYATDVISVVEHEVFARGVPAVFERSAPSGGNAYVANVPSP
jgi:hypothetical protein